MLSSVLLRCYLGAVWKTWCGWQPLEPSAMVPISTLMGYRCTMLCMWVQFEGLLWCCYCIEAIPISYTPVFISKMQEKRTILFYSGFIDIYKVDSLLKLIITVSTWKGTVSEKKKKKSLKVSEGTSWGHIGMSFLANSRIMVLLGLWSHSLQNMLMRFAALLYTISN